ncbi:MAG TPA: acyl-CoA dehydrogenase [Deltaproteobacteria bacterium]|nr:acyl-CoA dehydrogenase [Deltaproteobacteria bacterium]HQI01464.1 acyl-CoA dehydrogenase [Deltaproteobacteria bacterium]
MQKYLVDNRDFQFVLFEFLELDKMSAFDRFKQFDRGMYEDTLRLAEKIAVERLFHVNAAGHKQGCTYDPVTRSVRLPAGYREAACALVEAGFLSISDDPAIGGTGMPLAIQSCAFEMFCGAGGALMLFFMLGHGAALLIQHFGTLEQKSRYVPKLLSGEWGGTMCLTEPGAGSDVGALKTKAVLQPDGTYRITGQKCFITNGDQDITDQIIYPVLARIEGDPPGTKGISLFIVPKYLLNEDGSLGERNDVFCTGIEKKMGAHGSATCSMSFGENERCIGYLLGERGRGMNIMFQMLNETRLEVGIMALGGSSAAYLQAVDYARTRLQGPHFSRMFDPDAPKVPIIEHPDVMRMLLWMKAYVEGERMLSSYVSSQIDLQHLLEGDSAREAKSLVDFLIPIVKAGNSDMAWQITSEAIQVHGGYGYCSEYPVEQFAVDCKILSIVEGTNGIQGLDFVMRKILMNPGQYNFKVLKERMMSTIEKAKGIVDTAYIDSLRKGIEEFESVISHMKQLMDRGKYTTLLMNVDPVRKAGFDVAIAWMHLWSLTLTKPKLESLAGGKTGDGLEEILGRDREAAFYYGKVCASEFWLATEFPKYFGKINAILQAEKIGIQPGTMAFSTGFPD